MTTNQHQRNSAEQKQTNQKEKPRLADQYQDQLPAIRQLKHTIAQRTTQTTK